MAQLLYFSLYQNPQHQQRIFHFGMKLFSHPQVLHDFFWWAIASTTFCNIKNRTCTVGSTCSIFFSCLPLHIFFQPFLPCRTFSWKLSNPLFLHQKLMFPKPELLSVLSSYLCFTIFTTPSPERPTPRRPLKWWPMRTMPVELVSTV